MRILGIDPAIHGGLAIVDIDIDSTVLVDAIDIPTIGIKAKERIDAIAVRKWIETDRPDHAAIERAGVMPRQGISSGFKYGRAVGVLEAVVALCGIPLTIVEPAVWKRRHGLYGADNNEPAARAAAIPERTSSARTQDGSRPR